MFPEKVASTFLLALGLLIANVYSHRENGNTEDSSSRLRGVWTDWINVDRPSGEGDFETKGMVNLKLGQQRRTICPPNEQIIDAECRQTGTKEIFHHQSVTPAGDLLKLACTKNGLMCLNRDQKSGICHDYNIRFFCSADSQENPITAETKPETTEPNSSDHHGLFSNIDYRIYLIIALVPVSVLLLRIWCSCLRRKRRRAGHRRDSQETQSPEDINNELSLPPPSYAEIFGTNSHPGTISSARLNLMRNNGRICKDCMRTQRSKQGNQEGSVSTQTVEPKPTQINTSPESHEEQSNQTGETPADGSNTASAPIEESSSERTLVVNGNTNGISMQGDLCCLCLRNRCPVYDNLCFADDRGNHLRLPGMHIPPSIIRNSSETSFSSIPPPSYSEALDILKNSEA